MNNISKKVFLPTLVVIVGILVATASYLAQSKRGQLSDDRAAMILASQYSKATSPEQKESIVRAMLDGTKKTANKHLATRITDEEEQDRMAEQQCRMMVDVVFAHYDTCHGDVDIRCENDWLRCFDECRGNMECEDRCNDSFNKCWLSGESSCYNKAVNDLNNIYFGQNCARYWY